MSKTGLMWLVVYLGGISYSFVKGPIIGLVTYMFTFYTQFSWARRVRIAGFRRWSFYIAMVLLASYIIKRNDRLKRSFEKNPQLKWLILMMLNMLFVSPFAADPTTNQEIVIVFVKLVVLYYLVANVVRNRLDYKLFIWVQLWGNFLLGWQAYTRGEMIGGRLENIGAPGIKGSNHLANHLVMIFPFMGNMTLFGNKWERIATIGSAPFIINALILCNSRGAFLAMACMAVAIVFLSKRKNQMKILGGIVLASVLFSSLADERIWSRMESITTYEEDGSAMGRLDTWKGALEMSGDYPFGKGGGGWKAYSYIYIPQIVEAHEGRARSMHNTFLNILTNWGIQGFVLFMLFLVSTFLELHKIRKRSGTIDDNFFYVESVAIEVALIGFLAAGMFGTRGMGESLYWYCGLATALSNMQQNEIATHQGIELKESSELIQEVSY